MYARTLRKLRTALPVLAVASSWADGDAAAHDDVILVMSGTNQSNWYYVSPEFKAELRGTCHYDQVNDVVFPRGCSELFVTCSLNDIRIWNASLRQEVIRIQVRRPRERRASSPRGCSEAAFDMDAWCLCPTWLTGWLQVPSLKCTCLGITPNGGTIVSGWSDGKVRAFLPQSGKLSFVIPEAQPDG